MTAHILVAEDQTDIRELLVMNLRGAGYEVTAVGDGEAERRLGEVGERRAQVLADRAADAAVVHLHDLFGGFGDEDVVVDVLLSQFLFL